MSDIVLGIYQERLTVDSEELEVLFKGYKNIHICNIDKRCIRKGLYKLILELHINGTTKKFTTTTRNVIMIEEWNDDDGKMSSDTIMSIITIFANDIKEHIDELQLLNKQKKEAKYDADLAHYTKKFKNLE